MSLERVGCGGFKLTYTVIRIHEFPAPGLKRRNKRNCLTSKFWLMSATVAPCSECHGKFGSGPVCGVCETLLRLRLFVVSGRCPNSIGNFVGEKVREAHRLVLEEAERWWASQPVDPPCTTSKAPPPQAPPLASGGGGEGEGQTEVKEEAKSEESQRRKDKKKDLVHQEEEPKSHRRHHSRRHRRSRSRRSGRKEKRRSRTPSPAKPVEPERSAKESPRSKKSRTEPEPSEPSSSQEEIEVEPERPSGARRVPSSASRPTTEGRKARTPSRSPPKHRRRWEGPIPAYRSRQPPQQAPAGKKKAKKKNKGITKRENHQRWLREGGRYRYHR